MGDAEQFVDYSLRGLAPRVDFSGVLLSARRVMEEVHDKKRLRERPEAAGVGELADTELAYPTFTAIAGLVARRAARELGVTIGQHGWSLQSQLGVAEWDLGKDHDRTAVVL